MFTIGAFGIIFDDASRVLLCHRRDMDMWMLPGGGQEGPATQEWLSVQRKYAPHLQRIFEIQAQIETIHPLLTHVFPIALVENEQFLIFDVDPSGKRYTFVKQAPTPMPIPQGVRAAFPLECYGGKPACVVTADVFDTLDGYVTIFNEFVHCYQYRCAKTGSKPR